MVSTEQKATACDGVLWLAWAAMGQFEWGLFKITDADNSNDLGIDSNGGFMIAVEDKDGDWHFCICDGNDQPIHVLDAMPNFRNFEYTGKRRASRLNNNFLEIMQDVDVT